MSEFWKFLMGISWFSPNITLESMCQIAAAKLSNRPIFELGILKNTEFLLFFSWCWNLFSKTVWWKWNLAWAEAKICSGDEWHVLLSAGQVERLTAMRLAPWDSFLFASVTQWQPPSLLAGRLSDCLSLASISWTNEITFTSVIFGHLTVTRRGLWGGRCSLSPWARSYLNIRLSYPPFLSFHASLGI